MTIKIGDFEFDRDRILESAPAAEPQRQLYFCARVREILKARFERDLSSGEALLRYGKEGLKALEEEGAYATFHIETYGCRLNIMEGIV